MMAHVAWSARTVTATPATFHSMCGCGPTSSSAGSPRTTRSPAVSRYRTALLTSAPSVVTTVISWVTAVGVGAGTGIGPPGVDRARTTLDRAAIAAAAVITAATTAPTAAG